MAEIFRYSSYSSTGNANYSTATTSGPCSCFPSHVVVGELPDNSMVEKPGKYSIFDVANWFLAKSEMTHKKLQKLCYYAQAWNYALNGFRLLDTDFQAWIHGPVSPVLYEKFKAFGYDCIRLKSGFINRIDMDDLQILEDVWETYGNMTGNALEALSHRELPWIEARKGYAPNERCTVVVSPETMADYYQSIYTNK